MAFQAALSFVRTFTTSLHETLRDTKAKTATSAGDERGFAFK
jgi:hypothetical protein